MTIREYLNQAIKEGRTIKIEYVKDNGEHSIREVSNLSYSEEFGNDYIDGYCHLRDEYRTFKISRIRKIDGKSFLTMSGGISSRKSAYSEKFTYKEQASKSLSKPSTYSSSPESTYKPSGYSSSNHPHSTYSSSTPKKNEGCYIATMVYGDYGHPQVMVLRRFRDEKLLPTATGKLFVKFYYWISPKLVKILSGHKKINSAIRHILDYFVNYLKMMA